MATVAEKIAETRDARETAEQRFRSALARGRRAGMSWNELAKVAGMKPSGVRYLVELHERETAPAKGGSDNGAE